MNVLYNQFMHYNNEKILSVGKGLPLSISWELVTHCQFSCSYCYFNPYESSINYPEVMKLVLAKLKKVEGPVQMTLLGGEPTLHPHFYEIISELYQMDHIKKIDVITNFQPAVEFWLPLSKYSTKLEIVLSYHVEYAQNNFFKKIQQLKEHFPLNVIFLVHNDLKYLPKLKQAADEFFSLGLETVTITFSRLVNRKGQSAEYFEYPSAVLEFLEEQEKRVQKLKFPETVTITTSERKFEISQLEFENKELNQFKGWKCQMNALIIHPDAMVSYPCTTVKKHILFAEIKKRELVCAHDFCSCVGYWDFTKTL